MFSLPGADIVGFIGENENCRFALGEVKSSSESNDLTKVCQLLKWLLPRVKNTSHQTSYDTASVSFFNSNNKSVAIFGVLIRDTSADEKDLFARGSALRNKFTLPTTCNLIAIYLPWSISELPTKIRNGGVL